MLTAKLNRPFIFRLPGTLLPLLSNGLMLVLLSYLFSQIGLHILKLLYPEERPVYVVDTGNIPEHITVTSGNLSRTIASLHLFGEASTTKAQVKKPIVAPATRLNFTLRGIISEDHKHEGLAIIQNNDRKEEKYFAIKDSVFNLATLEEIYEDRVILLRNGKYETLRLPEDALPREHFQNSKELQAARKRVATNYRNRFLTRNGMDLIKLFGFRPMHRAGGFHGFVVTALGEEGRLMMETLGVMEGDLITVVNGMRLSESLEAISRLKELKTATSVDVIIERDGNEIPFHFELDPPPPELAGTTEIAAAESAKSTVAGPAGSTADANSNKTTQKETDEDLGEDWGVSEEDRRYMEELRTSTPVHTGRYELEYDH